MSITTTYSHHPISEIFPLIKGKEFDDLCDDIEKNGLHEAVWLYEGKILDGRNRHEACSIVGAECKTREYEGDNALEFVLSLNLHRRHLNESQRGMVAASIANLPPSSGRNQHDAEVTANVQPPTRAEAAEKLNVSERTVNTAKKVQRDAAPEVVTKVQEGSMSVSAAAQISELPKEEQKEIVERGPEAVKEAVKQVKELKQPQRKQPEKVTQKKLMLEFLTNVESLAKLNGKTTPPLIIKELDEKHRARLETSIQSALILITETKKQL